MTTIAMQNVGTVVLSEQRSGQGFVHSGSPLVHLNYFDGMFMRAEHLKLEQQGLRSVSHLSNQAGGFGVVQGYDTSLVNGSIRIGQGMAIDMAGRLVYLPGQVDVGIGELIAHATSAGAGTSTGVVDGMVASEFDDCVVAERAPPGSVIDGISYYVITVGHIEGLCGEEDVYGRLCEEACITASDRPYLLEGVVVRAEPFPPSLTLPDSSVVAMENVHRRSRIASAYFDYERRLIASLISAEGLASDVWCQGAHLPGGTTIGVPVALLARAGSETLFLDRWIVTRERMESPPRRYWAQTMAMRPWNVFLAQVLQFQCQLNELFRGGGETGEDDPCADIRGVMRNASTRVSSILEAYSTSANRLAGREADGQLDEIAVGLKGVEQSLADGSFQAELPPNRLLISGGLVELPSAGYLPVKPDDKLTVNDQVRRLMGEGVDLRFCSVRPDFVPHALEEAQHMERISLLQGLDDPSRKPRVDVLVPGGEVARPDVVVTGTGYEMNLDLSPIALQVFGALLGSAAAADNAALGRAGMVASFATADSEPVLLKFSGAARGEDTTNGGYAFHYAGEFKPADAIRSPSFTLIELLRRTGIWLTAEIDRDPFALGRNDTTRVNCEMTFMLATTLMHTVYNGDLQVRERQTQSNGQRLITRLAGTLTTTVTNMTDGSDTSNVQRLNDRVNLTQVTDAGPRPTVSVDFPQPSILGEAQRIFGFASRRVWSTTTNATVEGSLRRFGLKHPSAPSFTLVELNQDIPLFTAAQRINPAVLEPANSAHEASISVLRSLGSALRDPQFEEVAVRKLFPPPKVALPDVQIRAATDWVLFHRRRDKDCGEAKLPAAKVSSRKYRLYVSNLGTAEQVEALHQALVTNDPAAIRGFEPAQVGVVEFSAGIQTLESLADVVRAEWKARSPESGEIVYGAVASTGEVLDEGAELARARLSNLGTVLSLVTPLSDDPRIEALQSIPDAAVLTAAPHDGVMVMATVPVQSSCQRVFRFQAAAGQQVTSLLQRIARTQAANIVPLLETLGAQAMGAVAFNGDEAEIPEAQVQALQQAWANFGGGPVSRVILVSQPLAGAGQPAGVTEEEQQQLLLQSSNVAQVLNATIPPDQVTVRPPLDTAPLDMCPGITILASIQG